MKEVYGNLFDQQCDAICITTNGFVKWNGEAVMGRGCALEAKKRWPSIPAVLGQRIGHYGNVCQKLTYNIGSLIRLRGTHDVLPYEIISFPVKHKWLESADKSLIIKSAMELSNMISTFGFRKVILPRPGCGNGGLDWGEVKELISPYLDDAVHVITGKP